MTTTPKWAEDLKEEFLAWWFKQGKTMPCQISLRWRHSKYTYSSGHCHNNVDDSEFGSISISAGKKRIDQKLVLLHEIAHLLAPGKSHNEDYWNMAWDIFNWAKIPIKYAKHREGSLHKKALVVYEERLKEGKQK